MMFFIYTTYFFNILINTNHSKESLQTMVNIFPNNTNRCRTL